MLKKTFLGLSWLANIFNFGVDPGVPSVLFFSESDSVLGGISEGYNTYSKTGARALPHFVLARRLGACSCSISVKDSRPLWHWWTSLWEDCLPSVHFYCVGISESRTHDSLPIKQGTVSGTFPPNPRISGFPLRVGTLSSCQMGLPLDLVPPSTPAFTTFLPQCSVPW